MDYVIADGEIDFTGTASFTGGTGRYRGIKGRKLTATDHNTFPDGQNGRLTLEGDVKYCQRGRTAGECGTPTRQFSTDPGRAPVRSADRVQNRAPTQEPSLPPPCAGCGEALGVYERIMTAGEGRPTSWLRLPPAQRSNDLRAWHMSCWPEPAPEPAPEPDGA